MIQANNKTKSRWRRFARIVVGTGMLFGVLLYPLPVRDSDRSSVMVRDAKRLRDVRPVFVDWLRRPFYDAALIARCTPKWHLYSNLDLELTPLEHSGFRRMMKVDFDRLSWGEWYASGNVLLEITGQSSWDEKAERGLRFHVHHGTMGAQGYEVRIYRCLLGTFAHYSLEWVS